MKKRYYNVGYVIVVILVMLSLMSSCGKKEEKPVQLKIDEKTKFITSIDEKIESIIEGIEMIQEKSEEVGELEKEQEKEDKKEEEKEKVKKEDDEESDEKEEEEKTESKEDEKSKEDEITKGKDEVKKYWEKVNDTVKEIHTTWNDYELKAIADGIDEEDIRSFEEALNNLTIECDEKKDTEILIEANKVTRSLGKILEFYKTDGQSEMMELKYYIRQTHLLGVMNKWEQATDDISKTEPILNKFRQRIKTDEEIDELLKKLRLSIDDIKDVIPNKNVELLKIKRDIALKNLEEINKKMK